MEFSTGQIRTALLSLIAFIISVSVHEFGHAWMADKLGDDLPRKDGRVTLSPLAHIDLWGTIVMPLVAALAPGNLPLLAWGKPVMVNPSRNTRGLSPRNAHLLIALAGPCMNLVLAALSAAVLLIAGRAHLLSAEAATTVVEFFLVLNMRLMFFNLLPVPPLDGSAIIAAVLPARLQFIPQFLSRYDILLFLILFISGALGVVMRPADRFSGFVVGWLMGHVAP